jgi:signal transduction histidine kinase
MTVTVPILVADDDPDIVQLLGDRLEALGHQVTRVSDGEAALAALEQEIPQLVLLDIEMPKLNGIEVLKRIKKQWPQLPVVILTAHGSVSLAVEAMKMGAADFLTKPFEGKQLQTVITTALQRRTLHDDLTKLVGEISHDVKNLLMPVTLGTDLLSSEISELFSKLPAVEAVKMEASRQICNEVMGLLQQTARCLQERTKTIADYVRIQSLPRRFAPCHVAQIIERVANMVDLLAREKSIRVSFEQLDDLPTVVADEARLYSLFYNLVHNAIAAVPAGGAITIRGQSQPDGADIVLIVEDTGVGMSPEICARLFSGETVSRKPGGTGLGMKIIKETVEAHGGTIAVQSTEGVGTTFSLRLPRQPRPNDSSTRRG